MLTATLVLGVTHFAEAANTKDRLFEFNLKLNQSDSTAFESKHNTTRVYVRIDKMTMDSMEFHVDGAYNSLARGKTDVTVGGKAYAYRTGKFHIRNNVHEYGYSHAVLRGKIHKGWWGEVKGAWSPDSKYKYEVLN